MDVQRMKRKLEGYAAVSFDIFDTLLKRDVWRPADVFELVEREYRRRCGRESGFATARVAAERAAREKSAYAEVTLDEIYQELDITDRDTYKALELEMEAEVLHCNHDLKAVFDWCAAQGKAIYIISDMYLPAPFLESVLRREGYQGYRALILSADYRKTKRSGALFAAFLERYGVKPKDVIHIGDSRYADYIGARKCGIRAIHIPRTVANTLYLALPGDEAGFESRTFRAFVNTRVTRFADRNERLGYEVLGPVLYAYCRWIHDRFEALNDGTKRLWFAARDMYLFKEAYRLLYPDGDAPDYMYISRRSLRPVLTVATGDITESGNAFPRGEVTLERILRRMGYGAEDVGDCGVDLSMTVDPRRLSEYPEARRALSSPAILEREAGLAEAGMKYLKAHGFTGAEIVLADVGWHGTTQYILQRILDATGCGRGVYGLYLGCLDSTNDRIGRDSYQAFAFDEDRDSAFAKGILLFEGLILAPHGSTMAYREENGEAVPVLGEPDNISRFLASVQAGAIRFVEDYHRSILRFAVPLDDGLCTEAFCKLAVEPLREELDTIGQMDYDDFGIGKMAEPKPLGTYILHPGQLYYDLKHCPWRIGFLYKLFGVRLPYAKLYAFLRNRQGKRT